MEINDEIKNCIKLKKEAKEIKEIGIKSGMITFEDSYSRLIEEKITTLEECIMNKPILS